MLTAADRRPWIVTCRRGDGLRLICFPMRGGPSLFRGWPLELSQQVEVCAVQLPGREARMKEPPIGDLRRLVVELADAIEPSLDRPFALFGHSVGDWSPSSSRVNCVDAMASNPCTSSSPAVLHRS